MLFSISLFAQQGINYKAIIKDGSGVIISNQLIQVQFIILDGAVPVYRESHGPTTDANGMVILNIGEGTPIAGVYSTIDWSSNDHFLNVKISTGSGLQDMGTTAFKTVPYALHAITAANTFSGDYNDLTNQPNIPNVSTYSIGDFAHGGIVFWVDPSGQHGLVCAKSDQSAGVRWYAGSDGNTQAKGDGVYAGQANTAIIIASQVAIGDDNATYAARICNELQITEAGIIYGDWYLPSQFELFLMWAVRSTINTTAAANGGADFVVSNYWSSTEAASANSALLINFPGGNLGLSQKNITYPIRAVRSF